MNAFTSVSLMATPHTHTADMSDLWVEITDAENVLGETCTALVDRTEASDTVVGLIIEGENGATTLPRVIALDFIAEDEIRQFELSIESGLVELEAA